MKTPSTWSTWDVRCLNAVMKLPEMAEVRVMVYDSQKHALNEELRWEALARLGPHDLNGEYSCVSLLVQETQFTFEFASQGDQFVYKVIPHGKHDRMRLFVAGLFRWNASGAISHDAENWNTFTLKSRGQSFEISICGKPDLTPINTVYQGALVYCNEPVYIRCNHSMPPEEMDAFLERKRAAWQAQALQGGGVLADAPEAMVRGILWNTIFEPVRDRICTPVTRNWCISTPDRPWFGSYVLFVWDTCFNSLIAAGQSEALAQQQIYSLLQGMVNGMLPMLDSEINVYDDRSQPPIGSFAALKLFHQFGNAVFLAEIYERLLSWHRWWVPHRDGNKDGLLEWGTDLPVTHTDYQGYLNVAKCESMDNSPMYDDTTFDPEAHTMRLADVGLNSFYALDCWSLAEIARILREQISEAGLDGSSDSICQFGLTALKLSEDETALKGEYEGMRSRINERLWNEKLGIYCNLHWDGRFSETLSPTCFYPMLAGIAPFDRAERMIREHLLNPGEFWGPFALPASAKNHPSFADNDYWRGRIWAPTNFLVYEGLKRMRFEEPAYQLAQKGLHLFLQEWQGESHIHENYNTLTGDGDDVENADPVYTWGGLLALTGLSELVHVQMEGGLTIGSVSGQEMSVKNWPSVQGNFSISSSPAGLSIQRSDGLVLVTDTPVQLYDFMQKGVVLSFRLVNRRQAGKLRVQIPAGIERLEMYLFGEAVCKAVSENEWVEVDFE